VIPWNRYGFPDQLWRKRYGRRSRTTNGSSKDQTGLL